MSKRRQESQTQILVESRKKKEQKAIKITAKNPSHVTKQAAISTLISNASAAELIVILTSNVQKLCSDQQFVHKMQRILVQHYKLMKQDELRKQLSRTQDKLWHMRDQILNEKEDERQDAMNTLHLFWKHTLLLNQRYVVTKITNYNAILRDTFKNVDVGFKYTPSSYLREYFSVFVSDDKTHENMEIDRQAGQAMRILDAYFNSSLIRIMFDFMSFDYLNSLPPEIPHIEDYSSEDELFDF
jgi:hypothetical protein